MSRPTEARIDLVALRRNYLLARRAHGRRTLAVLSADAFGHGAVTCAKALRQLADGYAVGTQAEALALRENAIRGPVLVLEGVFGPEELLSCGRDHLWIVVHQGRQIDWIEQAPPGHGPWQVWLRVDAHGQGPGFAPHEVGPALERLRASRRVSGLMLMDPPESHGVGAASDDWARTGLDLYGVMPESRSFAPEGRSGTGLTPVMSLCSAVTAERWVPPGTRVSCSENAITQRRTRVGWVALGLADGYPQSPGPQACVHSSGLRIPVLGRPGLHRLAVDLTDHPDLGLDSVVEAWGPSLAVDAVARESGTTAEALLCGVRDVRRAYHV